MRGLCFIVFILSQAWAAPVPTTRKIQISDVEKLKMYEHAFLKNPDQKHHVRLKLMTKDLGPKAVPTLIKVMKENRYPEKNRWQATFLLGQTMGRRSAPFIAKFIDHPLWVMRVAALKSLHALNQRDYLHVYQKALKDSSLIVRVQALDSISRMKIEKMGSSVWNMLYDQSNYTGNVGQRKRTSIVKSIVRTLGDIQYRPAQKSLAKLIQKPRYKDLVDDLDYSLEKLSGMSSPDNSIEGRRKFWQVAMVSDRTKMNSSAIKKN
jgi:HEAT repeat protein